MVLGCRGRDVWYSDKNKRVYNTKYGLVAADALRDRRLMLQVPLPLTLTITLTLTLTLNLTLPLPPGGHLLPRSHQAVTPRPRVGPTRALAPAGSDAANMDASTSPAPSRSSYRAPVRVACHQGT